MADTCELCGYFWKAHPPGGECPVEPKPKQPRAVKPKPRADEDPEPTTLFEYLTKEDDSTV